MGQPCEGWVVCVNRGEKSSQGSILPMSQQIDRRCNRGIVLEINSIPLGKGLHIRDNAGFLPVGIRESRGKRLIGNPGLRTIREVLTMHHLHIAQDRLADNLGAAGILH
jgi:hypothetical protein